MQPGHRRRMGHEGDMWIFDSGPGSREFIFNLRNNFGSVFSTPDVLVSHSNGSSDYFEDTVHTIGSAWQAARLGRRDIWRNVRVPFLELLPQYGSKLPHDWVDVPTDMVVPYSSFIGMPIRGGSTSRAGNSSIQVQSHYMTLSCGPDFNGSSWLKPGAYQLFHHNLSDDLPLQYQYQGSSPIKTYPKIFLDFVKDNETIREHNLITYFSLNGTEPSKKLQLVIGGSCPADYHGDIFLRTCDVSTTYVEVEVNCTRTTTLDDQNCQATRLRHTPGFPLSGNLTAISNSFISTGVVWEFPFAASEYHIGAPGVIEMYLKDPPRTFSRSLLINSFPGCFSNVSRSAFEARLATSLNTFIAATTNSTVLTGADGTSLKNRNYSWKNATATWTEFTDKIYLLDKLWFPIWLISTIVLLIMAVANVIFRTIITAPDFLNGVAGLTRDSPYVKVPQDHSGETGSDRLRRLKDTRVRICDVQSEEQVGKITLTTELNSSKLEWERVYI
ncbi:hypothetical protein NW762_007994 [Fusarium torreyae]|uniref:Uncharacterized protein n=1 Tax=Fusarium torreyae TaxID=1237075 RepID=A0A9W8RZX0_9HYPO|nr:hypothetical protein NW762_007994 [Fusarium torreyae]